MDDERQVELDCISAIFPEMTLNNNEPFSSSIDLPVNPRNALKVLFPVPADGQTQTPLPTPPHPTTPGPRDGQAVVNPMNNIEFHNFSYLPSLQLHIILPEGYPATCPPKFELSTSPAWLSRKYLDELEADGERMWEEAGRTEIVFGYIDSLQQAAENAFGYGEGKVLEMPQEYKIALLDYDIKATQAAFEKETFDCGVCLDPKKGSVCHKMIDCGHVFCVQCLQEFYNNAINEGDLVSVRCLTPDCAKKRGDARISKNRKPKIQLSPSELLQIPLEPEMVTRYVKLKHKADLESDKNTIYCPRKWCQGAARSKKHKKPEGFEVMESEEDTDSEEAGTNEKFIAGNDLLCVCEDCSFAFCSRCYQGWHGEFTLCTPKQSNGELTEEDKASMEYMKLHTTPCPTCAAPAQKTHGCNHMICFKCNTHFCYLCSAWLEPSNPYKHYNLESTACFMRLWELEAGDGNDVGIGFGGGVQRQPEVAEIEIPEEAPELNELAREVIQRLRDADPQHRQELEGAFAEALGGEQEAIDALARIQHGHPDPPALQQEFQREGPLVLRINQVGPLPAPAVPAVPALPDLPQPLRRNGHRRRGNPNQRIVDQRPINARAAVPNGQARRLQPARQGRRPHARADGVVPEQDAAHQAWVQMFVEMALNDEEDLLEWDSDDEEDAAAWEIPAR